MSYVALKPHSKLFQDHKGGTQLNSFDELHTHITVVNRTKQLFIKNAILKLRF